MKESSVKRPGVNRNSNANGADRMLGIPSGRQFAALLPFKAAFSNAARTHITSRRALRGEVGQIGRKGEQFL